MSLPLRSLARRCSVQLPYRSFHSTASRKEHFLNANAETFEHVTSRTGTDKIVLVDFYADWCKPCKSLTPILKKLTKDPTIKSGSGHSLDLLTVDTDEELDISAKYDVRSLPTVIAFKDGKPIRQFIGAIPEPAVRKFLGEL